MRFDVLTVIPEAITPYLSASILGRAADADVIQTHVVDLRAYGIGKHRRLDDAPYGGGSGMVMMVEPLVTALEDVASHTPLGERRLVLMTAPGGRTFDRDWAHDLATDVDHLVLLCGRYEGIDARIESYVDGLVSIGDYVITGGEVAAMVVVDAVARLLPGALGNAESTREESFEPNDEGRGLLEYPQYTRPRAFRGLEVPDTLLSGDHARIAAWRRGQAEARTRRLRPDLLKALDPDGEEE